MTGPLTIHTHAAPPAGAPPATGARRVPIGHRWRPAGPRIGSLCTGYGGLDLGVLAVLSGRVVWCADPDRHVRVITRARFPDAPNLGDITALDWAVVPAVDVITAGFPCQDLSSAGKGAGITEGTRSGLWLHVLAAVRALRPALVFVENVAALRWRRPGIDRVLGGLAEAGYDASWRSVRASDVGAPHQRERIFLLAHPTQPDFGREQGAAAAHPAGRGRPPRVAAGVPESPWTSAPVRRCGHHLHLVTGVDASPHRPPTAGGEPGTRWRVDWGDYTPAIRHWEQVLGRTAPRPAEPLRTGRLGAAAGFVEWVMGLPAGWVSDLPIPRSAQLRALGNGVVPAQAAHALRLLITDHPTGVHPAAPGSARPVAERHPPGPGGRADQESRPA